MSRKSRHKLRSDSNDYHKGYADGMKAAFEESELDAYYAGVGYGKKAAGTKHLGFTSDKERIQFEAGIKRSDNHFRAYRSEPPSFWERLFCGDSKKERATGSYKKARVKRTRKRLTRKRNKRGRKRR